MPAMGDSVAEGTVLEWHKHEGESIGADETLVEISTDKVDAEVPSPVSGTIVKIHAAEGDTVAVGALLAEISTNGATVDEAMPVSGESPPATPEEEVAGAATEAEGVAAADATVGETIDIVTPTGGESVTEGTILEWSVKVGDSVKQGDTVVEISTDKVDMELPAPATGEIVEILAQDGETVSVGQVIARMTAGAQAGAPAASAPPAGTDGASASAQPTVSVPADAGNASPVARRVAAQQGIDLTTVHGSARGGRITKADVIAAAAGNGASAAPAPAAKKGGATLIKGGAAVLARYMDESRSIPTATSFRTLAVTALEQRRQALKQAGHRVSFTHLIAYAIARVATEELPVMAHHFEEIDGKPHRIDDGGCNLGLAVDVERKDGTRTLMVPVIRDAGRLSFDEFLDAYNALVEKARTNTLTADDLVGANVSLTNPGGIGTIASVPRLMTGQGTIVATGSIAYPVGLGRIADAIGAEKVMTMTSTYDHRIIQGAESGRFLQRIEAYLHGEDGFYERVFGDLGLALPALPAPPAPAAAPAPAAVAPPGAPAATPAAAPDEDLLQAVQAATSLLKAHRTHGHLAARLDPLGREPEGDPALDPEPLGLTPELMARIPSRILQDVRGGRHAGRRAAELARDLLRADRLRDRAHRLASPAAVAARGDRVGPVPQTAVDRRAEGDAAAADRGRRARAVHAQGVLGPEAVLDRGPGHDRPDARRADRARRRPRRSRGRDRHRPPRPAEHPGPQPRPPLRHDLRGVRGHVDARADHHDPAGRHRRRQVPPRRTGQLPAPRPRVDHRASGIESEPPRVRRAGRVGRHARGPDHPPGTARASRHRRGDSRDHPRRRRVPRPGRGRRDVQPAGARRLHGRRHDPHHPEQPGRVHHRPRRFPLDDLGIGPRQGLRRPDHPRQRRRRGRVRRRGAARVCVPPGVRPRRADRPDRLPPLRPQRGRRARLHPARDVPGDQEAPARARAVRQGTDRRAASSPSRSRPK